MKLVTWAGASLMVVLAQLAGAQAYPNKPIRWVVPFPPGGGAEFVGSTVAKKLTEALKQPVVIELRPGGAGAVGAELIAKASPDGYSLLQGQLAPMSIYPALHAKPAYDPNRDFAPISRLVLVAQLLVVHPSLPVKSLKELVALAKANPGQIIHGTQGYGSGPHLAMEWLKSAMGINMVPVHFQGAVAAVSALVTGNTSVQFAAAPGALPRIKSGKLRAIAVGSATRSPDLPDIPTVAESGVPGFEYVIWYGLFAPANTPKEIVDKLNTEVVKTLKDPETVRELASRGAQASPTTPEALAKYLREDQERWKKVVKTAGIKVK
ncbi:MAG: tripartite tricarboxylate transporter substrate binding protein [Deltaproteobacteria bacterium]|nr:tripartite tricarboxylate transporter substrate binding protein [Deltaproteobacteria bacterium]